MNPGSVAIYREGGPLAHIMAGSPLLVHRTGEGLADVEAATIRLSIPLADLSPGRLWWRGGRGAWHGPYEAWADARASLEAAGVDPTDLERGAACPAGASMIAGGWRYRLAWGGERPPERYG